MQEASRPYLLRVIPGAALSVIRSAAAEQHHRQRQPLPVQPSTQRIPRVDAVPVGRIGDAGEGGRRREALGGDWPCSSFFVG